MSKRKLAEKNTNEVDKCGRCGLHFNVLYIRGNEITKLQLCKDCLKKEYPKDASLQEEDN